jgi:hypothetical protein
LARLPDKESSKTSFPTTELFFTTTVPELSPETLTLHPETGTFLPFTVIWELIFIVVAFPVPLVPNSNAYPLQTDTQLKNTAKHKTLMKRTPILPVSPHYDLSAINTPVVTDPPSTAQKKTHGIDIITIDPWLI